MENNRLSDFKFAFIGSRANSWYKNMSHSASVAKEATQHGSDIESKLTITPSSEQVRNRSTGQDAQQEG